MGRDKFDLPQPTVNRARHLFAIERDLATLGHTLASLGEELLAIGEYGQAHTVLLVVKILADLEERVLGRRPTP